MLSKNTISILSDLLINLAKKEGQVEINRQVLCQNLNFDAYQVFAYLDLESKNYLNEINLFTFLNKKNGIPCTIDELQHLILLYDENFDGKLSYSEFLNIVLSDNNFELRKKTRERIGSCYDNSTIEFNIEYSLVKLFQKELDLIRTTKKIIEELKSRDDFNVHDLFHYLKGYSNITVESIKIFLEKNCREFDEKDLKNIVKRLDINNDSKIDFSEFHQFLCFPNLKCNCCSFCQCNCIISNKNLYNKLDENEENYSKFNIDENLNYNYIREGSDVKIFPKISRNFVKINNYYFTNKINPEEKENKFLQNNNIRNENNNFLCQNYNDIQCCNCCPCDFICIDSNISENKFLEYITKLIIFESKIEKAKIDLIKRPDFNIEDAFYIFCNSQSKVISISDFKNGLKEFDLYPTSKEIKLIMRRADKDNKNYLNFDDFFDLLTPFQKEYREKVEKEIKSSYKPKYNKSDVFLFCTKIYLSNLIRLIIECESELNFIKENIIGINIYLENIFNKIDKSGLGFISEIELFLYLQNSGIKCNEIENGLIFKRFDKNKNEKIEIWEIEDELKSL